MKELLEQLRKETGKTKEPRRKISNLRSLTELIEEDVINPDFLWVPYSSELFGYMVHQYIDPARYGRVRELEVPAVLEGRYLTLKDINAGVMIPMTTRGELEKAAAELDRLWVRHEGQLLKVADVYIENDIIYYRIPIATNKEAVKILKDVKWKTCEFCDSMQLEENVNVCESCGKVYCNTCATDCYRCIGCENEILILAELDDYGEEK